MLSLCDELPHELSANKVDCNSSADAPELFPPLFFPSLLSNSFSPSRSETQLMFPCNYPTSSCWRSASLIAKEEIIL